MLKLFLSNWRAVLYYRLYHGLYHGLYHVPVMMWSCHGHVLPASPHPAMRLKQLNMYFPHKLSKDSWTHCCNGDALYGVTQFAGGTW